MEKGFKRLAFADILRQSLYNLNPVGSVAREACRAGWGRVQTIVDEYGWDYAKVTYPEIRELLQRFGTEVGRELYGESFWVDRVMNQIERKPLANYVITDVRFPNEERAVHTIGGRVFRITRPGTGAVNTHVSDTGVDTLLVDGIIPNTGSIERYREMVLEAVGID